MAFISPASANALLSSARNKKQIGIWELTLANIFNTLPATLLHLPTLLFLLWPTLGQPALIYVTLSLIAASGRALLTMGVARICLKANRHNGSLSETQPERVMTIASVFSNAKKRFFRRLPRLLIFTIPVYILMYILQHYGLFKLAEHWLGECLGGAGFIKPEMLGIIIFSLAAESGAAIGAAGALLHSGALTGAEIVQALLVGNIISTPMRALRHQLPAYAGFYRPALALWLVVLNQLTRAISMIVIACVYILH